VLGIWVGDKRCLFMRQDMFGLKIRLMDGKQMCMLSAFINTPPLKVCNVVVIW